MKPDETQPAQKPQPDMDSKGRTGRLPWVAPAMERLDLREAMAGTKLGAIEVASS